MQINKSLAIVISLIIPNSSYIQSSEVINIPSNYNEYKEQNSNIHDNKSLFNTITEQLGQSQQIQNNFLIQTGKYIKYIWEILCYTKIPALTDEQKFLDYISNTMS